MTAELREALAGSIRLEDAKGRENFARQPEMPVALKTAIDEKLARAAACFPGTSGPSYRRASLRELEEIYVRTLPQVQP